MKTKLRSERKGSRTAAKPQPQTRRGRGHRRAITAASNPLAQGSLPPWYGSQFIPAKTIALLSTPDGNAVSEEVIDLSADEYRALTRFAGRGRILMFMACHALSICGVPPRVHSQPKPTRASPSHIKCLILKLIDAGQGLAIPKLPLLHAVQNAVRPDRASDSAVISAFGSLASKGLIAETAIEGRICFVLTEKGAKSLNEGRRP